MIKITVNESEEYQVKIASYPDEDEFFLHAYEQARNELNEIIDDTVSYYNSIENAKGLYLLSDDPDNKTLDFSNNIIAFSGDRGQGKSSAMLSFSNFLKNISSNRNSSFMGPKITRSNFIVLDRIDPTKFEDGDEVLVIILARLFHVFSNLWASSNNKNSVIRGELLEKFQNCYDEIDAIKSGYNKNEFRIGSDMEKLGRIGDSAYLKKDFHALLQDFFRFYNLCNGLDCGIKNNYLVIQLDDTDLKVDRAKDIVEDIRKYFMVPNVVILMAVDLKQLTYAIEQGHIAQFSTLQDNYGKIRPIPYHEIAVKYIDKLIPGRRKVFLPDLRAATDEAVESVTLEYLKTNSKGKRKNILAFSNRDGSELYDMQELILRFIYEKTGLIFIKPTNHLHNIIPRTMRSLVNFLSILNNMKSLTYDANGNIEITEENIKQKLHNIESFEMYFKNTWIPNHIVFDYSPIIDNFIASPWTIKSKNLLRDLKTTFSMLENSSISDEYLENVFDEVLDEFNDSDSYSLSDILYVLKQIENRYPYQTIYRLTFAIRTIYSLVLNKMVCNILLHENNGEKYDNWEIVTFLGGDIFGSDAESFIRSRSDGAERSVYEIKFDNIPEEFSEKMQDENFAVLISLFCYFDFPRSNENVLYKNKYKSFGNNLPTKNLHFNITYPFINLIQPDNLIERAEIDAKNISNVVFNKNLRLLCMEIISNVNLISRLSTSLKNQSKVKTEGWSYSQYVDDFFKRLERELYSLSYLPLNYKMSSIQEWLKINADNIDYIYSVYDNIKIYEDNERYKNYMRGLLSQAVSEIKIKIKTKTFEELRHAVSNLSDTVKLLEIKYDVDMYYYLTRLEDLDDILSERSGEMDDRDREVYQKAYNDIVRDLKEDYGDIYG